MAETTKITTLDAAGVTTLSQAILEKVNTKLTDTIATTIDENSTNEQAASAKAVFEALKGAVAPTTEIVTVMGAISTVENPSATTIYLQKDDENDETWEMYLWVTDAWVSIGSTDVDLSGYLKADDTEAIQAAAFDEAGAAKVKEIVDYDNLMKDDAATKEALVQYLETIFVRQDSVEALDTEAINAAVNAVDAEGNE
ncbi:MAG: hypothetical protein HDQ88_04260 [Clostridia bacterium]|nr:hypothetical protein [Clostridia bacterium]